MPPHPQSNGVTLTPEPETPRSSGPVSPEPLGSQEMPPSPEPPVPGFATLSRKLMLGSELSVPAGHLHPSPGTDSSSDGHSTPTFPISSVCCPPGASPGAYSLTSTTQPPLPEKRRQGPLPGSPTGRSGTLRTSMSHSTSAQHHVTFSSSVGEVAGAGGQSEGPAEGEPGTRVSVKFVQDSSRFWYKPGISRDQGEWQRVY